MKKSYRRITSLILVMLMVLSSVCFTANAVGETITYKYVVTCSEAIAGFDGEISYPSTLSVNSVSGPQWFGNNNDKICFNWSSYEEPFDFSDGAAMVTVVFNVNGAYDASDIHTDLIEFYNTEQVRGVENTPYYFTEGVEGENETKGYVDLDNTTAPEKILGMVYEDDVDTYKATDTYTCPEQDGLVFAGWFTDIDCNTAYTSRTGKAFAKFVDEDMHKVYFQIQAGTTRESDSTYVRMLTATDDLNYRSIGFYVWKSVESNATEIKNITNAYAKVKEGSTYATPKKISKAANWFETCILTNIPKKDFNTQFYVRAYWITLDGTRVKGEERSYSVGERFN